MAGRGDLLNGCLVLDRNEDCAQLVQPLVPSAAAAALWLLAATLLLGWWCCWRPGLQPATLDGDGPQWEPAHGHRCVAVVTGGNRGLGLQVVRRLQLSLPSAAVVLCCRDVAAGEAAAAALRREVSSGAQPGCAEVVVRRLDATSDSSVKEFSQWLANEFGGLDILVNNHGIADDSSTTTAERVLDTNFHGVRRVCEMLLPLLRPGGRVVVISSSVGRLSGGSGCPIVPKGEGFSPAVQRRMLASDLTPAGLVRLVDEHLAEAGSLRGDGDCNEGQRGPKQWPASGYAVSKAAATQLVRLLAADPLCLQAKTKEELGRTAAGATGGLPALVVALCPGLVRTGMVDPFRVGSGLSSRWSRWSFWAMQWLVGRSAWAAAADVVWLALLPPRRCRDLNGRLVRGRIAVSY
jgi:carbonyl reductase 1